MSTIEQIADAAPAQADGAERHGGLYAAYALGVLIFAYVIAFVDRQILNLLVEPIKRDLHLTDTQVSLLQGLSFALCLSLAGLPIGRLIDTQKRTSILSIGIVFWSLATVGCGLARNYMALLLCRIGVGAGEATMTPSAYSLIGDYFSPRRLGLAAGIYSMGSYVGTGLALIFGAAVIAHIPAGTIALPWIGAIHGWQSVFLIVGPLGAFAALWVFTLREPQRRGGVSKPSMRDAVTYFGANWRSIALVNLAIGCTGMAVYGLLAWTPSLFMRVFHWHAGALGLPLGLLFMIPGAAGTLSAGLIGDALRQVGLANGRVWTLLSAVVLAAPLAIVTVLAPNAEQILLMLAPLLYLLGLAMGSGPATLQEITPNRMRGLQHAVAVLAANILGLGIGPTMVALVTDYVLHDEMRLAQSLAMTLPVVLSLAALFAVLALGPYKRSIARMDAHS